MLTTAQFEKLESWVAAAAKAAAEPTAENTAAAEARQLAARSVMTRCCMGGPNFGNHSDDCREPRAFA